MSSRLQFCEVEAVETIGEGTRVCLDLADRLEPEEGLLLGDTGHGYLLVLSENQSSETYPPRPFRVNCGAIHHYLLGENEKTRYLSDLTPEMSVMVVHAGSGAQRMVPIGRIKIEKRPLLRIIARYAGKRISATLQQADSVRLMRQAGEVVDVKSVQPGDSVCFLSDQPGRHLGERIEEDIQET
ncbi:3-dehydroquinate synthase [Coraliomargarita sinensis]|uniref:3-dehydroquinate synthase n=1 Tax=Coraliomargarita sinensis TaxID=2174842 RepID=A0A317ZJN6_9BACT|nr:3-dehydroquinate synthase II [Coraliomargarita sinensis]PXA04447.1 3-dehydroquinate synthase [Coraliomargarita sinensis]